MMPHQPSATSRAGLEPVIDDACVVFALRQESRSFCREFRPQQDFPGAPCWAKFCGPPWLTVLAIATGVGRARTERVMSWLLSRPEFDNLSYRPKLVLAAGFCGALQPGLRTGDMVLANELIDAATAEHWPATWPGQLPAGEWRPPLRLGRLVTVPRLVAVGDEKQALGRDWSAVAVDMESATIARVCHEARVPFGCLRVVLDELDTNLSPNLVSLMSAAKVAPLRLAAAVIRRPRLTIELWDLARRSRLAADQLGKALGEVLTLTLPWMQE